VNRVNVIEVEGNMAICDGGNGALGHPVEYIQLDNISSDIATCKYCGLRFKSKHAHH
jgi:NADH dehydrogenase (ubiquinone) Fe-S protein 6